MGFSFHKRPDPHWTIGARMLRLLEGQRRLGPERVLAQDVVNIIACAASKFEYGNVSRITDVVVSFLLLLISGDLAVIYETGEARCFLLCGRNEYFWLMTTISYGKRS